MNDALEHIINRNDTWRGRHRRFHHHEPSANSDSHSCNTGAGLNTGFSSLDAQLDQGGWPLDSTIELLSDGNGLGAMGLFLPAMQQLSEQGRWQAFIAPPYIPYAPLLAARGIDTQQVLLVQESPGPAVEHRAGPAQQHLQCRIQLAGNSQLPLQ